MSEVVNGIEKNDKERKSISKIGLLLWGLVTMPLFLVGFGIRWAMKTWVNLSMEEMIYHLRAPLDGSGDGMIQKFVLQCLVPAAVITIAVIVLSAILYKKYGKTFYLRFLSFWGAMIFCGVSVYTFWKKLDVTEYIENQTAETAFIEQQYVDPLEVGIEFPEKKRNLIFIYLESMETTYADIENGGGFEYNCIPELTKLAQENEDFSGSSAELNGGNVMASATWTMGALFAQTAGLPLQVSIDGNAMNTQEHFFPGLTCLGDILEMAGYSQSFLMGSEGEFGGRKLYFEDHGGYEIKDYQYAIDRERIPSNYKVFWGYEDKKLFEYAKEELLQIAKQEKPFNFSFLTVDTHFEDGYLCEDCGNDFAENQYANVMACSSKKVMEFITWVQQQAFYENTTIVLSGDHLTMDSDFCNNISPQCTRKTYTCIINPGCENEQPDKRRSFTTMDMFPTTLAALGVEIEGDRLGLGTNLFSSTDTLTEELGFDYVKKEVAKKSEFLERIAALDETTDAYLKKVGKYPTAEVKAIYEEGEVLRLEVSKIENLDDLVGVELELWEIGKEEQKEIVTLQKTEGVYAAEVPVQKYTGSMLESAICLLGKDGRRYSVGKVSGDLELYTNNFYDYFSLLSQKGYTIFITVCDEAAYSLNYVAQEKMKELGLQEELRGKIRYSYYAVIDGGKVLCENISQDRIGEEGLLADGKTKYGIMSSGFTAGSDCSVRINGKEYAMGKRGLNVVVYDAENERVMDSVCFDTYSGNGITRSTGTVEVAFLQGSMEYMQEEALLNAEFCEYLQLIRKNHDYSVFVAIQDEGTYGLTGEMKELLHAIGLQTDLTGQHRRSYYAVIDGGTVKEQLGDGVIEAAGSLNDGTVYEIRSEGYSTQGAVCSIMFDGLEFAVKDRGMNFVIYDNVQGCVVDAVVFDTYSDASAKRK